MLSFVKRSIEITYQYNLSQHRSHEPIKDEAKRDLHDLFKLFLSNSDLYTIEENSDENQLASEAQFWTRYLINHVFIQSPD